MSYHFTPSQNSTFQSLGQVLAFLYVYCGFCVMEKCTAGSEGVFLHGVKIADISWDEEKRIPVFSFIPAKYYSFEESETNQDLVLTNFEYITAEHEFQK